MPPKKRKSQVDLKEKSMPKRPKSSKKANTTTKSTTDQASFSIQTCGAWFNKYKDPDISEGDLISPEGSQEFFNDLDVSLESIDPITIGWQMGASRMGFFTRREWMQGMQRLECDSVAKLKSKLPFLRQQIDDGTVLKKLYLFTFFYAKTTSQKSMDVDTAIALWQVLLEKSYPLVTLFIQFLQDKQPVKVINKDQWSSLFDFCRIRPEELSAYDSTSSWPVLFDTFVEWKIKQDDAAT